MQANEKIPSEMILAHAATFLGRHARSRGTQPALWGTLQPREVDKLAHTFRKLWMYYYRKGILFNPTSWLTKQIFGLHRGLAGTDLAIAGSTCSTDLRQIKPVLSGVFLLDARALLLHLKSEVKAALSKFL